ncbi:MULTISPECIES: hypothetical protein [unclassified Crossiella]|uniref:hypothetical protein n=1 Tax=unclassified Crossiella TaxID=2620835 RepID=UPI001FFFEBD8|nr:MULTISPECIES: hypothetical protein [unclassified Crossiella]MCK2242971.1 hypothetical protein [Crossiella sp. S99.2]MCK2256848.1 hypothetical protein [Crossiella sp. S99.1]
MRWRRFRAGLRQHRQHRPFRIAEPAWDAADRTRLTELAAELTAVLTQPPPRQQPPLAERDLAVAATHLWKARRKIYRSEADTSREGRQIARFLRTVQESLDAAGVRIQDHTGVSYNAGLSLEVLAYEENPEVTGEVVTETVRPSVYVNEKRIQMGQVLVGFPPADGSGEANHE